MPTAPVGERPCPPLCCDRDGGAQALTGASAGARDRSSLEPRTSHYYADAPNRAFALLLDAVFLTVIIFVAAIAVSLMIGPAVELDTGAESLEDGVTLDRTVAIVDAILSLLVSAGYFVGSWVRRGGTPGQRLVRLEVVTEAHGATLTAGSALVRWALLGAPFSLLAVLITALPGVGDLLLDLPVIAWYALLLITVVRSATKQGLHDRAAGTVVVKRARPVHWAPRTDAG